MPRQPKPCLHRGWYITDVGGERTKLCRESEGMKAALTALGKLLDERATGQTHRYQKLTVAELAALYLASREGKVNEFSYANDRRYLTWFAEEHGNKQASAITRLEAQQFHDGLMKRTSAKSGKPLQPATLNRARESLRQCWQWGNDTDLIPAKNPFDKLPKLATEGRHRLITDQEFQALMREAVASLRWVLLILRYTSMRPGELRKLTWSMIDWANHRLVIARHKTSKQQKTPKPRIIPFPVCVERLLRALQRRHGDKSPYVFLNAWGRPWAAHSLCEAMARIRERAGIVEDENGETLVLYSNRHTYITTAASNGVDGPTLQNLAGHTNPAMTAWYTHLADRTMNAAACRVAEALKPQRPGQNGQGPASKPGDAAASKPDWQSPRH
jgi:integrase